MSRDDERCGRCGEPLSKHEVDQMTLEPTKCPVQRAEPAGLGGELSPRSNY
ncbi:CxxC motif protein [Hardygib1 virus]|nr:CxxC motif protein [Hardygib1 virus]